MFGSLGDLNPSSPRQISDNTMACVSRYGRLYPADPFGNGTESDDSAEWSLSLNLTNSTRSEGPVIVCMQNPQQMLAEWDLSKNKAMLISYFVIFITGVLGNITAMLGMIGDRKSRNATTLFLVSLSAADLLLLLVCAPLEVSQYFVIQWDESGIICKTAKYAEVLSAVASVLNLTAVSIERFIVIVFPIRSRSVCTMSNCRRAVLVVWIVSLLLTAPILFTKGTNPLTFTDGEQSITINYCEDKEDGRIFAIYQAVILLLAPGLVMIICYTYVIRELWISTRNMRVLTNTTTHHNGQHRERRWRSGSSRWLYQQPAPSLGAGPSSPTRTVATTPTGTLLVVGATNPATPVRGHEACLLPCHGPCSANNQASSCKGYGTANGQLGHNRHSPTPPTTGNSHREAQLMLARKPLRETLMRTRPTIRKTGSHQARAEDARNARKQVIKMLILVIVLFLICWGSRLSMEISIKVGLNTFSEEIYHLRIAINLLPYVHSCLNPFIYSLMSKNFRRSMWRRIHCCCCFCTGSYCCPRRRCFCHAATTSSSSAATGQTDPATGNRSHCRHCRQFSSHYNLNDLSVGVVGAGNAPQEIVATGSATTSRMKGLATRLAMGSSPSGGTSPLLLMRSRSVNNHTIYSTSVIQECESDCCL